MKKISFILGRPGKTRPTLARARPAQRSRPRATLTGGPPRSVTGDRGAAAVSSGEPKLVGGKLARKNRAHPRVPRSVTLRFMLVEELRLEWEGSPS
jgi:hypothetical protein